MFAVNTNGSGFANLHNFAGSSDGSEPYAGLLLSGSTLYGTAFGGGDSGYGTVFAVNTNGSGFTNLYSFAGPFNDGANPFAGLIISGNTMYGTTSVGGSGGAGTVFAINTDGSGFANLHSFAVCSLNSSGVKTNSEGAATVAGLILSSNTLYGTALAGGISGNGTVFALNTSGLGFSTLYSFTPSRTNSSGVKTNSDGANPSSGLIFSGNTMYGKASYGGSSGFGTVFSLTLGAGSGILPVPLLFSRTSNKLVFTWANTNFTLQSAPLVTGTYTNIPGATNSPYTNPITGSQRFFRLIGN